MIIEGVAAITRSIVVRMLRQGIDRSQRLERGWSGRYM